MRKNKKLVYGIGLNDLPIANTENEKTYWKWAAMLNRCYGPKCQIKYPTYVGCTVCDEWKIFSKFKEWHDQNNRVGMHNDKDILVRGNKIYGPEYCRFIPKQINTLLTDSGASRGSYKQGVCWDKQNQKFRAQISRLDGTELIGLYTTEDDAFAAYKTEKEKWIKTLADHYFSLGQIDKDVHTALHNWTI